MLIKLSLYTEQIFKIWKSYVIFKFTRAIYKKVQISMICSETETE